MRIKVDILSVGLRMCLKILIILLNKLSSRNEKLLDEIRKATAHHESGWAAADKRVAEAKEALDRLSALKN